MVPGQRQRFRRNANPAVGSDHNYVLHDRCGHLQEGRLLGIVEKPEPPLWFFHWLDSHRRILPLVEFPLECRIEEGFEAGHARPPQHDGACAARYRRRRSGSAISRRRTVRVDRVAVGTPAACAGGNWWSSRSDRPPMLCRRYNPSFSCRCPLPLSEWPHVSHWPVHRPRCA